MVLLNYTADGTDFWNTIFIAALRYAQDNIANYVELVLKLSGTNPSNPEAGKQLPKEVSPIYVLDYHLLNEFGKYKIGK